jgi:TIGR02453 family protein
MSATVTTFKGFSRQAIQFLADLAANNDRAWFQPRKADYERLLKEPMELLCVALAERFRAHRIPLLADPKRSVFRIYRDTRFSKDKSPYKTHIAASFAFIGEGADDDAAEERHGNGAYFHFQPGEMYMGGGMWHPEKERLDAFRTAVVAQPDLVRAALEEPDFVKVFGDAHPDEELKRVPVGYPADHALAHMLRWKDVVFGRRLSDAEVLSAGLPETLVEGYAAALPVLRFLAAL